MFPPTPPPDNDRASASLSSNGTTSGDRRGSARAQPKLKPLDLSTAGFDRGLARTKSERSPRNVGRPTRAQSERPGVTRRPSETSSRDDFDDINDVYGRQRSSGRPRTNTSLRPTPGYISEEDDDTATNSFDEPEFEMLSARSSGRMRRSMPDIKKIRVKVHAEDSRYVMVSTPIQFKDFIDQIRNKFGLRQNFKVKIKDEGDMITMADQDDLDMAITQSKSDARKEKNEMGKMEVWIQVV